MPGITFGMHKEDSYVTDEAQSKRGELTLKLTFATMTPGLRPTTHSVLRTKAHLNPEANRERIVQTIFYDVRRDPPRTWESKLSCF